MLDIEGTTTPISFVTEILFPYAKNNVGSFLTATYNSKETQSDIELLRVQVNPSFPACSYTMDSTSNMFDIFNN